MFLLFIRDENYLDGRSFGYFYDVIPTDEVM